MLPHPDNALDSKYDSWSYRDGLWRFDTYLTLTDEQFHESFPNAIYYVSVYRNEDGSFTLED